MLLLAVGDGALSSASVTDGDEDVLESGRSLQYMIDCTARCVQV